MEWADSGTADTTKRTCASGPDRGSVCQGHFKGAQAQGREYFADLTSIPGPGSPCKVSVPSGRYKLVGFQ